MRHHVRAALVVGTWLGLVGVAAAGPPPPAAARPHAELTAPVDPQAIVGGVPTEGLELDAVVALSTPTGGSCTGSVVAPRLILTAAHCLTGLNPNDSLIVQFGPTTGGQSMVSTGFGIHPRFCDTCEFEAHDYGYVLLPEDYVPADGYLVPITQQHDWDEAMRIDNVVLVIGYGTDDPNAGSVETPQIKRKVSTTIRRFTDNGLEFFAGGQDRDTCNGDSGGPAIVELSSGRRLAGVTSRGSRPCGRGGWYGIPFDALWWIRSETGVDLLPEFCLELTCLDTTPPAEPEGCGCRADGSGPTPVGQAWWALSLMLLRRRPRRSS